MCIFRRTIVSAKRSRWVLVQLMMQHLPRLFRFGSHSSPLWAQFQTH